MLMRCVVALLVLLGIAQPAGAEPPFSRSRWIEENMGRLRFSGGVLPTERIRVPPASLLALPAAAGLPNFRVSFDIVQGPHGNGQPETQAEPHVAINPANLNHLLGGYQEVRFDTGGARALVYAYSTDGGRKWKEAMVPGLTTASGGRFDRASDPWVAFGPDNRAYFVCIAFNETNARNGVYLSVSKNGGKTFGAPVTVHENNSIAYFDDKESMVVDTSSTSPYRGYVYVGWDDAGTGTMYVSRSTNGGADFQTPVVVDTNGSPIAIVMVVAPSGYVYAFWYRSIELRPAEIVCSRSTDGGAIWSAPRRVAEDRATGVPELRTGDIVPMAAVDARTGALYVVWQDARWTPGVDQVLLSRSTNAAASWSTPVRVSDGPNDAANFTAAVAVSGEGKVGVCYYSLRNDPARRYLVDEYMAISSDKGKTFGAGRRVSKATFDVRLAAQARGYFLGDYQGIAAGARVFHPFFVATLRNSVEEPSHKQPDTFASRVIP
ncbi:MAG: sialidase family protein [Acidobacteriota bacterium]